jgi:hypothetical protein
VSGPGGSTSDRHTSKVRLSYQPVHPRAPHSRRLRVARDLNVSEAKADKILYGEHAVNLCYAEVIRSDVKALDHEAVATWIAPAEAALLEATVPGFMEALCAYDQADAAEDLVQAELRHKPVEQLTDAELESYARALARELYKGTQALAALRREQQARRAR